MKLKRFNLAALYCAAITVAVGVSGCIDNAYDLSDIDTTSELKVKDLVLPVNLDPVVLSDIISINDDGKIQTVNINGKEFYAVEETGSFHSDPVEINSFSASPQTMEPTRAHFSITPQNQNKARKKALRKSIDVTYHLQSPVIKDLNYEADGIDESIHSVEYLEFSDLAFNIDLTLENASIYKSAVLNDIVLVLPKQLKMKSITPVQSSGYGYNPSTGELKVQRLALSNGKGRLTMVATGIDMKANNAQIDYPKHQFVLDSHFNINDGSVDLALRDDLPSTDMPADVYFNIDYTLGNLHATSFTGMVEYNLDGNGLDIAPVEINDLPEFLADERTNLMLYNPQLYLNLTNPVGEDNLSFRTGVEIVSNFKNGSHNSFELNTFEVQHDLGNGPYNYCLSPEGPSDVPSEFSKDLRPVAFPNLGNILSGEGLPSTLDFKLVNPQIYLQKAAGLKLGVNLPSMEGTYKFLAPLALKGTPDSGSLIVYTDTEDGWNDEDLDALTIETLELNADVTSTVPLVANLKAWPLDKNGKRIEGVEVVGADIPSGTTSTPISIRMTGKVQNLDGVTFEALVHSSGSAEPLAPNQSITLNNIRVKVSGNYTKEF